MTVKNVLVDTTWTLIKDNVQNVPEIVSDVQTLKTVLDVKKDTTFKSQ